MRICAVVRNRPGAHEAEVRTGEVGRAIDVPPKAGARGSSVNGGEFLLLALATCYCNDLFREAERLGIPLDAVEVQATAEFPGIGLAARDIRYHATVDSPAPAERLEALLRETDAVAEVHNTVRAGVAVVLDRSAQPSAGA